MNFEKPLETGPGVPPHPPLFCYNGLMRDYLDEYIIATRLIHRAKGASIEELAEALGKTERSVFKTLSALDAMYFPIYTEPDPDNPRKKRYYSQSTFAEYLPDLTFSAEEKAVFNYLIDSSDNTPGMERGARLLLNKLKLMAAERGSLIENTYRKSPTIISSKSIVKDTDSKKTGEITTKLLEAIADKRWVALDYTTRSASASFRYVCFPIVMFTDGGNMYAYIYNSKEQLRMLAIERIKAFLGYEDLPPVKNVEDVQPLLEDPFGIYIDMKETEVTLYVKESQAGFVRDCRWPDSVTLEETGDGLMMHARTRSFYGLTSWVLSRVPSVKVVSPEWLKDEMVSRLREGLAFQES